MSVQLKEDIRGSVVAGAVMAALIMLATLVAMAHAQAYTSPSPSPSNPAPSNPPPAPSSGSSDINANSGAAQNTTPNANGSALSAEPAASSSPNAPLVTSQPENAAMPMVVSAGQDGTILIRGVVESIGTDSFTLASWGGTWTVRVTGVSQVTPPGGMTGANLTGLAINDFVGAEGVVAPDQRWTVNAQFVRDWTESPPAGATVGQPSAPVPQSGAGTGTSTDTSTQSGGAMPAGDSLFTGTASNVSDAGFTLTTDSGVPYSVTVASGAMIWNANGDGIQLAQIKDGDAIRLDGALSGNSITADIVRDTSL